MILLLLLMVLLLLLLLLLLRVGLLWQMSAQIGVSVLIGRPVL